MQQYNKLIVALLIPIVGIGLKAFDIDFKFGEDQANSLVNFLVPILTALGVWGAKNEA